jgi:hypothetical protein
MSEIAIEVITISDPRRLPYSYIEYRNGGLESAKESLLKDKLKHPDRRRYPEHVNTIYHFVSETNRNWQIIAFAVQVDKPEVDKTQAGWFRNE